MCSRRPAQCSRRMTGQSWLPPGRALTRWAGAPKAGEPEWPLPAEAPLGPVLSWERQSPSKACLGVCRTTLSLDHGPGACCKVLLTGLSCPCLCLGRFWSLLQRFLPTHSICSLPFVTSFCLGMGTRRVCYGQVCGPCAEWTPWGGALPPRLLWPSRAGGSCGWEWSGDGCLPHAAPSYLCPSCRSRPWGPGTTRVPRRCSPCLVNTSCPGLAGAG